MTTSQAQACSIVAQDRTTSQKIDLSIFSAYIALPIRGDERFHGKETFQARRSVRSFHQLLNQDSIPDEMCQEVQNFPMKKKLMIVIALLALIGWFGQVTNVGASTAIIVLDHAFAKHVSWTSKGHIILINRTSTFTQDDPIIYAYVKATFYSANLTWNWYDPSGNLYSSTSYIKNCVASPCDEDASLRIQGTGVATSPGLWRLDFLAGGSLIYSDYFWLNAVITQYNFWNFTVVRSSPPQINGSLRVVIHPSNLTWSQYEIYILHASNVTAHDYSTNQPLEVATSPGNPIIVELGVPRSAGYSFVLKFTLTYHLQDLGAGNYAFTWREYPWERSNDIHPIPERFTLNLPNGVSLLDAVGYNSISLTYNETAGTGVSIDLATDLDAQSGGWTILYRDLSGTPNVTTLSSGTSELNSEVSLPILPLTLGNLSVWAAVMTVFLLTASELVTPIYSRSGYGILMNRRRLRLAALLLVTLIIVTIAFQLTIQRLVIRH